MAQEAQGNNLKYVELQIDHSIPTLDDGNSNYDGVGEILKHLLLNTPGTNFNELQPPVEGNDNEWENFGELQLFS